MTVIEKERVRVRAVVPGVMTAAAIDRFGPPQVICLHALPIPTPGPNDVLIEMYSAGVGIWDARIRDGTWAPRTVRFPLVLGTDGAGIIVAKGARVRRFAVGDRVWAYEYMNPKGGFYAQYVAVDASHVGRVPEHLDLLHAGAAGVASLTGLQGVEHHLGVRQGQTVLVFGATGAVGTQAVQFANHKGARVIATASGSHAAQIVKRLGATLVFDSRVPEQIDQLPEELDAVLALAGGDALERCIDRVRGGGKVAYPDGIEPEPKRRRNLQFIKYDAAAGPREFARFEAAATEARLRVVIAGTYGLERAADAHQRLERGHIVGRLALQIRRG